MKVKKEYIILILVILGLSFYLSKGRSDRTHYELPVIPPVPQKTVTKMVISEADYTVELLKKDGAWRIQPANFLADESKVKAMLSAIENMTLTVLVSTSGPYERYLLGEDKKIHLVAYEGDKAVRVFDIGKPASSNQHTFIRLDKDPRVFHVRGDLRQSFDYTIDQLRDKGVLSFETETIKEISVKEGDIPLLTASKEALPQEKPADPAKKTKTDEPVLPEKKPAFQWRGADGTLHEASSISGWLSLFSNLSCDTYIDKKTKVDYEGVKALYTIQIKGVKDYTLSIFNKEKADDKSYPALSSENDQPFLLPDWKIESIKGKVETLKKPEGAKKE
jgi:hypothetical protein